jgi:hypothetical protein
MSNLREAAQQALEALEHPLNATLWHQAIHALRAALEQQEQEPVAWRYQNSLTDTEYLVWNKGTGGRNWTPLYTHPPRRKTEQEPVLWRYRFKDDPDGWILAGHDPTTVHSTVVAEPLYTHPPRREWRGLTEEEIYPLYSEPSSDAEMVEFARAIEAKLKERNA